MREKPRRQRHEQGVRGCSAGIGRCSRRRCSSEKRSVARRGRRSDGGGMRRAAIVQFFVETTVYEDLDILRRIWSDRITEEENARETVALTLLFGDETEISVLDLEAVRKHGWDVAG